MIPNNGAVVGTMRKEVNANNWNLVTIKIRHDN